MKLGELFVDLGFNKGNAFNDIANFSVKFLALGKLAQEVTSAFDNLIGDVVRYSVELSNTNKITGISINTMQQMKYRAEQVGISYESWLNTLKSVQKTNADIMQGEGNIAGFQKLGISMNTLRNPVELLDEIMEKTRKLEPAFRRSLLAQVGVAEDLIILYDEKYNKINGSLLLTEKEIESMKELNKEWEVLKSSVGAFWDKSLAKSSEYLRVIVRGLAGWFGADMTEDKNLPDSKPLSLEISEVSPENKKTFSDVWNGVKENLFKFEISDSKENNGDYFTRTDPLYNYGNGKSLNYTDNSQTIINTNDGVEQHKQIAQNKGKNTLSNVDYSFTRER